MPINIGVLCSEEGLALAALLDSVQNGGLPAEIKIVITDRNSSALAIPRSIGLPTSYVPRSAFHSNRDGFERRLVELLHEAEANAVVTADFMREPGPVLEAAYPNKIFSLNGIPCSEVTEHLSKKLRGASLNLVAG